MLYPKHPRKGRHVMFIVYGLKRFFRNLLSSALLTLLLTATSILLCLSVGLTYAADTICQNLDGFYTTLAFLRPSPKIGDYANSTQGNAEYRADAAAYRTLMQDLMTDEISFENIEQIDRRITVLGTGEGIVPITVGMTGQYQENGEADYPNNMAIVVMEMLSAPYKAAPPLTGNMAGTYAITQVITAHGSYDMLGDVSPQSFSRLPDEFDPKNWQLGEKYMMLCIFDERSLSDYASLGNAISQYIVTASDEGMRTEGSTVWMATKVKVTLIEGKLVNTYEEWIPVITRLDTDPETFLASDEGRAWREMTIPWVERQISAVQVTGTENVQSMQYFNTGKARLVEGRYITEAEYEAGANVCLVSAALAEENNWVPGDTVTLDLYPQNISLTTIYKTLQVRYDFVKNNLQYFAQPFAGQTYTIVGLYQTKNLTLGDQYYISPNTVFVPKQTIAEQYEFHEEYGYTGAMHANMISFVIPNGQVEAFRAEAEAKGYGNAFLYHDQGYSAVANMLMEIEASASGVMYMCLGLWIFALILVLFLFFRAQRRYAATMYGLGCRERQIYAYLLPQFLCLTAVTGILGIRGSIKLYDRIVIWMLNGNIRQFDDAFSALSTGGGTVEEVMGYLSQSSDTFVRVMLIQCALFLIVFAVSSLVFVLQRHDGR